MKQRHYFVFMVLLALFFLPFSKAKASWDMGTVQLGTITLTRGETKIINATEVEYHISLAYQFDGVLGWDYDNDAGFYTHGYQDLMTKTLFSVTGYATCVNKKLSITMMYTQSDGTKCHKTYYYLVTVHNDSYTKVERDVELAAAGTLSWRINSSDKNNITHLTLHGDLNGDDLKFLREMAGYNDNQGNLRYLDLRDVHFVAGGSSYATLYDNQYSITSDSYSIPDVAFYWCRKLTEIWLPEKAVSIGVWAFCHCDFLNTVHIPEGTKYIYAQNFDVCYNLKELSIPSTVTSFSPRFESSYKFRTLYCYAVTPPTRGTYPSFQNCTTLYVPKGCKNNYLVKEGWGAIANIYETLPLPNVLVTSISLNKSSLSLQTGQSETLTVTVKPDNATDKTVNWTSSNTSVATVDNNGKVTAMAAGSATITCKANDGSGVQATCAVMVSEPTVAEINATNFPDASFRNWLLSQSYGADGKLTASEICNITSISVSGSSSSPGTIRSLKGIEYFTSLTNLTFFYNQLTSLDVSKNTALANLGCSYNQLTSLDVSKNTTLTFLDCSNNHLTSLDVSKNTALTSLTCHANQLTTLDVSNNTALTFLGVSQNKLTTLDVTKNKALQNLSCNRNELTSLDVSANTELRRMQVFGNAIKGAQMDAFIASMPTNNEVEAYTIDIVRNDAEEKNICTKAQVAALKAKGWKPLYWNGTEWTEYDGSDEPDWGSDELTDVSQYSNIVYLEPVTASTESTITVPVKMKNAQANIIGFQFDLILPSGVTVAKDEDGFYLIELSTDRTTARKHTVSAQQQSDGSIRVVCYSNNNSTFSGTSGNVLEVMLQVAADAPTGEQSIKLRDVVMTTPGLDSYNVPWVVSRLTVEDYILGDVNGDKLVNVVDVAGVVNLILNSGNTSQLNRKAADVNGDGSINVVDVAGVVNIILGNGASTRANAPTRADDQPLLYFDAYPIAQGQTITLPILLESRGDSFTGCQFDLYLPTGLSVADEDGYPLVEIGSGTTARKHVVSTTYQPDGALRVVCYSNNNSTFSGDEILVIDIHADDNAPLGSALVALKNITLSRPDVTGVTLKDFDNELFVMGNDGIEVIVSSDKDATPVFSLSGQRLTAPRKGVNIIGGKKVVVK